MATKLSLYGAPSGDSFILSKPPRLESWDAKSAPSQVALVAYLDHVALLARDRLEEIGDGPLAIELCVGLPHGVSTTSGGYDLDNYLCPIARWLGHRRIASARASKSSGTSSTIRIGAAVLSEHKELDGWQSTGAETTVSTSTAAWKHQIAEQVAAAATPAADGPLELDLALAVASRRNWAWLWKLAIDSLGAILGVEDAHRPFSTRDDRIVRLALHRTIDDSLGNRVRVGVRSRAA